MKKFLLGCILLLLVCAYLGLRFYVGSNPQLIEIKNNIINFDALTGVLIGAIAAYWFNLKQSNHLIEREANTFATYTFVVLYKELTMLKGIEDHFLTEGIRAYCKGLPPPDNRLQIQKFTVTSLSFSINQDVINKIILSVKNSNPTKTLHILQFLISAEDTFRRCIALINSYNETFQKDFSFKKDARGTQFIYPQDVLSKSDSAHLGNNCETLELLKTISKAHEEAMHINGLALKHFGLWCTENLKNYKPPNGIELVELIKMK